MGEPVQERSREDLRHEYSEVVQNVRHYSNLRFAIFTIFFAVMGGVGFVAFGQGQFAADAALVGRIAGFAVIAVFWLYEERAGQVFEHYRKLAVKLEHTLNYSECTTWPSPTVFSPPAIVINRLIFLLVALLWVYAVFAVPLGR
ncbi:MAG: hypothetical protein FJY54_08690 [Betaproteobacteria bacterium]|nr:hypothetical protein [Betaproteobacteria bacterium]